MHLTQEKWSIITELMWDGIKIYIERRLLRDLNGNYGKNAAKNHMSLWLLRMINTTPIKCQEEIQNNSDSKFR